DELHIALELRGGIHVGHAAAARHAGDEREFMTLRPIVRHVPIEIPGRAAPVMKSVTFLLDPLAIHRWFFIIGLDELDIHMSREAHGERHIGLGIPAAVPGIGAAEMIEQEPRPHLELVDPQAHGRANIGHEVAHLDDSIVRLTESYETHACPLFCRCSMHCVTRRNAGAARPIPLLQSTGRSGRLLDHKRKATLSGQHQMSELILLSGLLSDDTPWIDVAARLTATCPVRILSFADCSSIAEMAQRVLVQAPERFALAGHSMGGRVALEVWRRAPGRIAALGLLNTGVAPRRPEEAAGRARLLKIAQ